MTARLASFFIEGVPIPQGSKGVTKRGVMFDTNASALRPWRRQVKVAAHREWRDQGHAPLAEPLDVEAVFLFPPVFADPDRHWLADKPDLDKLLRALFDGLKDGMMLRDDKYVVRALASKRYVEHGEQSGALVVVSSLAEHDGLAHERRLRERMLRPAPPKARKGTLPLAD